MNQVRQLKHQLLFSAFILLMLMAGGQASGAFQEYQVAQANVQQPAPQLEGVSPDTPPRSPALAVPQNNRPNDLPTLERGENPADPDDPEAAAAGLLGPVLVWSVVGVGLLSLLIYIARREYRTSR